MNQISQYFGKDPKKSDLSDVPLNFLKKNNYKTNRERRQGYCKRFVKNQWPILLLNVDTKTLSKSLEEKLKHVFPELISSNQTAYVKNRCISESGRLIFDVTEMCAILDIPGYLVTMAIEKTFGSLDHDFLLRVLKKTGFGENFVHWIKSSKINIK